MTAPSVVAVLEGRERFTVEESDALEFARSLPSNSVDSLVTDPPAGIGFMGKTWDGDKGGRDAWIAWLREILAECHRALKPGGYALIWALPRTSHWTATAAEDAGFEIRDVVSHLFGSGFPKSLDVSKALDKAAGATRETVGTKRGTTAADGAGGMPGKATGVRQMACDVPVTAPSSELAKKWAGFGTALKPASEHWILARKPLAGTVAANVAAHGTGAINIDACRIAGPPSAGGKGGASLGYGPSANTDRTIDRGMSAGRWPANVVLSHEESCLEIGTRVVRVASGSTSITNHGTLGYGGSVAEASRRGHHNENGTETVPAWECAPGCAVAALDAQSGSRESGSRESGSRSGIGYAGNASGDGGPAIVGSDGGASRFFYCAKPATSEREIGLSHRRRARVSDGRETVNDSPRLRDATERANTHPTVKSIALMGYLCRLVTPVGGVVLDVFTGSGTTAVACAREGFRFVGCEREAEYAEIARERLFGDSPLFNAAAGAE